MLRIEKTVQTDTVFPGALAKYFEGMKLGVFDIETTGLSPETNMLILSGFAVPEGDPCRMPGGETRVEQIFAEKTAEEEEVLLATLDRLAELDVVVTYNGSRFDMPFIERRCRPYGIRPDALPHDFDLYKLINKASSLRKILPNLKQKTVENYAGLWTDRKDEIDGGQSIQEYMDWELNQNIEARDRVLLHNADDVAMLTKLCPIARKADIHKGMSILGFPVKNASVDEIAIARDGLHIKGHLRRTPHSYYSYEYANVSVDGFSKEIDCLVPLRFEQQFAIIDLEKLQGDYRALEQYPDCASGYLVIRKDKDICYEEMNHFIRIFLSQYLIED